MLLLDEALSGVDRPGTRSLPDLLGRLASDGAAVLVATHDLTLTLTRSRFDRCLTLNGRLVGDGAPASALAADAVEAVFAAPRVGLEEVA